VGLIIGNRALQGGPMAPYSQSPNDTSYQGVDQYLPIVFLDRTRTPVVPSSIQVELDDITNAQVMAGPSTLVSTGANTGSFIYPAFTSGGAGAPWVLQISGAAMTMTYPYEGSQICQLKFVWTGNDSVTGNPFTEVANYIFELVGSPTVSGTL
jgi:hypothetical protein